ncbi:hypothetical protein B566_EDAN011807 [Ephemera danica]|nr:hypothetical protein B566_EDAN011807 [Ephemera danica]
MSSPLGYNPPEGLLHPVFPEVCLEHLWTEPPRTDGDGSAASRVFLATDLVRVERLCYVITSSAQLFMIKLDKTNQQEQLLFGSISILPALDAVPLYGLGLVLILEKTGGLALYSGTQLVAKVMVPSSAQPVRTIPFMTPKIAETMSGQSLLGNSTILSPTSDSLSCKWRRSSLRPECSLDGSYFGNTSCALSPVMPARISLPHVACSKGLEELDSEILRLRDPTAQAVTVEYKSGRMIRICLPEMHTSMLVMRVVVVLRSVLKKDEASILLAKWYCVRNAPGSQNIDQETEWHLFITALLGLLGYEVDKLTLVTDNGLNNDDWKWMAHKYNEDLMKMRKLLGLNYVGEPVVSSEQAENQKGIINTDAPLFLQLYRILYSLHVLYEDIKLDLLGCPSLKLLAPFLHHLALDLRETERADMFWRDFPLLCRRQEGQIGECHLEKLKQLQTPFPDHRPPRVLPYLQSIIAIETDQLKPYPYIPSINRYTKNVIEAVSFPALGRDSPRRNIGLLTLLVGAPCPLSISGQDPSIPESINFVDRSIMLMIERGFTMEKLQLLPPSLALMCLAVTRICNDPPSNWPAEAYVLISRQDLAEIKNQTNGLPSQIPLVPSKKLGIHPASTPHEIHDEVEDGMEGMDLEMLSLRFPKDQRIQSVRKMLQSARPARICVTQRPEVSDHDFIEEQERNLYAQCSRTLALPVGRGMFTLGTVKPNVLETLPIPRLCTTGRSPTRGTLVDLSHIEVVPNMTLWPLFHNGVAAGLRVCPTAQGIDSTWIAYNKLRGSADTQTEHAGFLMALGLNGHLSSLNNFKIFEYLQKCHELTTMLPPTSLELNIAQNVQVAALLGLGLLYQGSGHRHITEKLLSEIGRPPGPEMENCVDRESYSLAAGLALGLVVLGQGAAPMADLRDLAIPDTLHHYMVGGHARQLAGSQRDKYRTPSYQIREGDSVNVHVTCPGATLALGMLYFRTGNQAVAGWMQPPDTQYLLDFIRPDFLMLRVIARALILWDEILPTTDWVKSNVPPSIRPDVWSKPARNKEKKFDLETMNQAYNNILAGACFALGLRFAGSSNKLAFETIYYYVTHFISMLGRSSAEIAGKSTIECCTNVVMLSAALIMAGTGDLHCVRLIRMLRSRVGPAYPVVTYGSHLATHMALGLLFLGGGRYTLSSSPPAVAAMLCAFFPKFPTHSNDNRYHLQAFRHLYVLAAEPRLIIPRCVDTGYCDYTMVQLHYKNSMWYKDQSVVIQAPYFLPDLEILQKVQVGDARYWTVVYERGRNWDQLEKMLRERRCQPVKRVAGCLPYVEDPKGYRTIYAQSLTDCTDLSGSTWSIQLETILSFSKRSPLVDFARLFLTEKPPGECLAEQMHKKRLRALTYEYCVQDKSAALPYILDIVHTVEKLERGELDPLAIWDVKILQQVAMLIHYEPYKAMKAVVSKEASHSLYGRCRTIIDGYEKSLMPLILKYLQGESMHHLNDEDTLKLATYLTFYEIPTPGTLRELKRPWTRVSLMSEKILAPAADKLVTWRDEGLIVITD